MKMLKKIKTDMWINVFMMLLIGILFIVRPQDSLEVTAIIAGAVIFANGIFDLIYYLRVWADFYSRGNISNSQIISHHQCPYTFQKVL